MTKKHGNLHLKCTQQVTIFAFLLNFKKQLMFRSSYARANNFPKLILLNNNLEILIKIIFKPKKAG